MQQLIAFLSLGAQGYVLVWIFHRLSPQAVTVDVKTVFKYSMKIFASALLAMVFIMLLYFGVVMITEQKSLPVHLIDLLSEPLLVLFITTLIQIIIIELPPHVSKRTFMTILFVVNGGIAILSWLAKIALNKLLV